MIFEFGYFFYKLFLENRNPLEKREAWLNMKMQNYLFDICNPNKKVLEFGGGGSTLYFSDNCKEVHTVEKSFAWQTKILKQGFVKNNHKFISKVKDRDYDIILIDSSGDRIREFEIAKKHIKPGGVIIFDNIDRYEFDKTGFEIITDYACAKAGKTTTGIYKHSINN